MARSARTKVEVGGAGRKDLLDHRTRGRHSPAVARRSRGVNYAGMLGIVDVGCAELELPVAVGSAPEQTGLDVGSAGPGGRSRTADGRDVAALGQTPESFETLEVDPSSTPRARTRQGRGFETGSFPQVHRMRGPGSGASETGPLGTELVAIGMAVEVAVRVVADVEGVQALYWNPLSFVGEASVLVDRLGQAKGVRGRNGGKVTFGDCHQRQGSTMPSGEKGTPEKGRAMWG